MTDKQREAIRAKALYEWDHDYFDGDVLAGLYIAQAERDELRAENAALRARLADAEHLRDVAERDKRDCTSIIVQQREALATAQRRETEARAVLEWAASRAPVMEDDAGVYAGCPGCGAGFKVFNVTSRDEWEQEVADMQHFPTCKVIAARAWLAAGATAGEASK